MDESSTLTSKIDCGKIFLHPFKKARFDPFMIAYCVSALLNTFTLRLGYAWTPKKSASTIHYPQPYTKVIRK